MGGRNRRSSRAKRKRATTEQDEEYEVEKILNHRVNNGVDEYFIKWKGYDGEGDDTWEQAENLHCDELVEEFMKSRRAEKSRSASPEENGVVPNGTSGETPKGGKRKILKSSQLPSEVQDLPSWEDEIECIEKVKEGLPGISLNFTLRWKKTGWVTVSPMSEIHAKCPMKALEYYANHLNPPTTNES